MSRILFNRVIRLVSVSLFVGPGLLAQVGCSRGPAVDRLSAPSFRVVPASDGGSARVTILYDAAQDATYQIRYTLDGSIPGKSSPLYEDTIVLSQSANVTARVFPTGADAEDRFPSRPATVSIAVTPRVVTPQNRTGP